MVDAVIGGVVMVVVVVIIPALAVAVTVVAVTRLTGAGMDPDADGSLGEEVGLDDVRTISLVKGFRNGKEE